MFDFLRAVWEAVRFYYIICFIVVTLIVGALLWALKSYTDSRMHEQEEIMKPLHMH